MEDEERKVDLSHRTIQDEQARLRKKRQKAENVFAVFKKPLHESLTSVLPVMLIVLVLCFTIAPVPNNAMVAFLLGGVMLIAGMGLFTLGSEMSMIPLGQAVGSEITRRKKVWIITVVGFLIGMIITVAEPDLQVLANQVPAIENNVIIWSVAVGVGVFLVIALLRIVLGIQLRWLLIGFYAIVFTLAMFVSPDFWAVAFDSGGVTTGPMTVPFIMALGVGVCAVRSDKQAGGDSFGLVALCSIGPIITVLILGLLYKPDGSAYTAAVMPDAKDTVEMFDLYLSEIPHYLKETASALLPIGAFLILFQLVTRRLKRKEILHMVIGLVYVYIGLTIFLMGVNVGFMPVGSFLGGSIASHTYNWILIPIAMVIGYFIVQAEPAVHVLNKQVEEITAQMERETQNLLLIGMPGCGKSTVAAALGQELNREVVEADALIAEKAGMSIPEIFARSAEEGFRALETEVLAEQGKRSGIILSTGGGCVTRRENYPLLHQNGTIFWLLRSPWKLPSDGRPLSQGADLAAMWAERAPLYERFRDAAIDNSGTVGQTAQAIWRDFCENSGH